MIGDVRAALSNAHANFESNVQDSFGQSILQEVFTPFENELAMLDKAFEDATNEQQGIRHILGALRAMI